MPYWKHLGIREELQPPSQKDGNDKGKKLKKSKDYAPACFTLNENEMKQVFNCLENIKVTSGYSAIPRRYLDSKKQRFSGMKSHDCHAMMTQLLPVALRGIMYS